MSVAPSAAFNTLAAAYDAAFTHTITGRLQRQRVWHFARQRFEHLKSGAVRVLELNCGTGEDALWLARQGFRVLATDVSPEMVALAQKKVDALPEGGQIAVAVCDARQLQAWLKTDGGKSRRALPSPPSSETGVSPFDVVFSNFGGLNCLSPEEMGRFGLAMRSALLPGGHFVAVVMGRFCAWETLYFLLKGRLRQAFRRLRRGPVAARLDAHSAVQTWYYSPREFAAFFPDFEVSAVRPIGIWLPPSYLDPFFRRFPRLMAVFNRLEMFFNAGFWARGADHYLISFVRSVEPRSPAPE